MPDISLFLWWVRGSELTHGLLGILVIDVALAFGVVVLWSFWDSFTHPGRWGPRNIEWLRADHGALPGLKWVQYASGVVALISVARSVPEGFHAMAFDGVVDSLVAVTALSALARCSRKAQDRCTRSRFASATWPEASGSGSGAS